ncbi:hypothetical protein GGTG_09565 [Gaeumannomyces tritici R3-111a-1]|uniref:LRR-containing protein second PH domain-containing protein n=1 Tax=Gaeumannomyces tritici (strain R3-111a-1) TaxID=644352 RepID=J3P7S3_GAET3|nr:hypothetical protein GGTG_09565 [Gaeumannomyces tritici R3-111a-1]EJT72706.1 hypothetical protein GGTG_09565 [Gaeumannomyces tritici R3-111a-1]
MLAMDHPKRHRLSESLLGSRSHSRNTSLPHLETAVEWITPSPSASPPKLGTSLSTPTIAAPRRRSIIRSIRALSITSPPISLSPPVVAVSAPDAGELSIPGSRSPRILRKQRTASVGNITSLLGRRESSRSDFNRGTCSQETTSVSQSSTNSIDGRIQWDLQTVKGVFKIIQEHQFRRNGFAYLVVTSDYVVKVKTTADVRGLFPSIPSDVGPVALPAGERSSNPEVLQMIPITSVVSASRAESSRPYFGLEIWWKSVHSLASFGACQFFAEDPDHRDLVLDSVHEAIQAKDDAHFGIPRVAYEIEEKLRDICRGEEPGYSLLQPEIFPVGIRLADNVKWVENESYYFAVGINLCYFVKVTRPSENKALVVSYAKYGLMNLECVLGCWSPREDRLELRFRKPLETNPSYLHMSSRFYYQIIQTLLKADELLRPGWPSSLRRTQLFRIDDLPPLGENEIIAMPDEYGSIHRTHKAFCAAYECGQVEWEIGLDAAYGPELRILPPKGKLRYEPLELLAIMRAARYNHCIGSISFRGVSLVPLWNKFDSDKPASVAYINHDGTMLSSELCKPVQGGSILAQEIHALAFCIPSLRQMDFTDSLPNLPSLPHKPDAQVLAPILNLLGVGLTNCNRILLSGCPLGLGDVASLLSFLNRDGLEDDVPLHLIPGLQALDMSRCSLCSQEMYLIVEALSSQGHSLQLLDISHNTGRVAADAVTRFVDSMSDLHILNLADAVVGPEYCALLPYESLVAFQNIQEIDISGYKLSMDTERALVGFLEQRVAAGRHAQQQGGFPPRLRQLRLNDCSIDGFQAARILGAVSGLEGLHLHLGSNPLERGIEALASAIALCSEGRIGLHMDMVEFRRDEAYVRLIQAITVSKRFPVVSLVGTAPTPLPSATCTNAACDALEQLLAQNRSIRWLDLSGYVGKLDDGQLGRGFGRAFTGLSRNTTLRVLVVRNQNLSTEVGGLGSGVRDNTTLRRLDLSGSELNLTSLLFMRKAITDNCGSLVQFPFSADHQQSLLDRALQNIPAAARASAGKDLKQEVQGAAAAIEAVLARNRLRLLPEQSASPGAKEESDADDDDDGDSVDGEAGMLSVMLDGEKTNDDDDAQLLFGVKRRRRWDRRVSSADFPVEPLMSPYKLSFDIGLGLGLGLGLPGDEADPESRSSWENWHLTVPVPS